MSRKQDKRIPLRQSLSFQQTKQTVIVAFIIGLVLSSGQIFIDYFSEQAKLNQSVSNLLETADDTAFYAAYNVDETGAAQITQGLVSNIPIISASITDDFGAVLGSARNRNLHETNKLEKLVFGSTETITRTLFDADIHSRSVGTLSVEIDPSLMADSFVQRAGVVFASGIVRNTILALAIFAVFYLTFTRSILRATQPILSGRDKNQIEMPPNHKDDEIGALINAFNDHLSIIDTQHQQIKTHNLNLEALIEKRTSQLNERNHELETERKLAIEASMAKSDFLAMMSHEIRTPMNGILGMAELLQKQCVDARQKEYIEAIIDSGKSMLSLMNSVLDFSRYELGEIEFHQQNFEPARVVDSIVFLLSASAEKKQLVLSLDVDPDVPQEVSGDAEKLRQVLLNLVTNAIKFTQQGFVNIRITADQADASHHLSPLKFMVSDSGIGIDAEEQQQIFEPYTQANNRIARRYGGSGMGLAICKEIIEQQGGRIYCSSRLKQGTQFIVELPFHRAESAHNGTEKQTLAMAPGAPLSNIKSLRVLVTDDLSINRKLLQGQLENAGHQVSLAKDGAAAVQVCLQQAVDVVLLDLHMPGLDGIETTHLLRGQNEFEIPIIGITAHVSEQKREECLTAGMNLVINKPIDQRTLEEALRRVALNDPTTLAPATSDTTAVQDIDHALIKQHLSTLGSDRFIALYGDAFKEAKKRCQELDQIADSNTADIQIIAHALSGLCANFGLLALSRRAGNIEEAADRGNIQRVRMERQGLTDDVHAAFQSLIEQYHHE